MNRPQFASKDLFTIMKDLFRSGYSDPLVEKFIKYYGEGIFKKSWEEYLILYNESNKDFIDMHIQLKSMNGYIVFNFPYNQKILETIKTMVDSKFRRWCPIARKWFVDASKASDLIAAFTALGIQTSYVGSDTHKAEVEKTFLVEYIHSVYEHKIGIFMNHNGTFPTFLSGESMYSGFKYKRELFWFKRTALFEFLNNTKVEKKLNESNLYKVLDVYNGADKTTIKKQFFQLAKVHHPDTGGNAEDFHILKKAYDTLMDDTKRKKYDASLKFISQTTQRVVKVDPMEGFVLNRNCGRMTARGSFWLGIFCVNKIVTWEDEIVNGRKMESTFNNINNTYEIRYN